MADVPLTAASMALGRVLAETRNKGRIPVEQVAKTVRVSRSVVTRIERGKYRMTEKQLADLCKILDISDEHRVELEGIRQIAQQPDWRQDFGSILDGPLGDALGLESGATRVRIYDGSLIPGLLQSEDYADALVRSTPFMRESEIRRRVELRMQRQKGIWSGTQELVAVVNWSAIEQLVGGRKVMRGLIDHLLKAIEQPNIIFRIIPREVGAYPGYGTGCIILDFPPEIDLPTVVWCETAVSSLIYEKPEKVETFIENYHAIWPSVLGRDETISYLKSIKSNL